MPVLLPSAAYAFDIPEQAVLDEIEEDLKDPEFAEIWTEGEAEYRRLAAIEKRLKETEQEKGPKTD